MLKVKPDNKGFTLVELIITVAIMTLIGVALVGIMTSNTVAFRKTKSDLDIQNVAEDTFNKISNDIMQAKAVYIKTSSNQYVSKLNSKYITADEQHLYWLFNNEFATTGADDFKVLKTENTSGTGAKYNLTQLDIEELGIGYLVPYDSKYGTEASPPLYDYCLVTYKFTKATDSDHPGTIEVKYNYEKMQKLNENNSFKLYSDALGTQGVIGEVDAVNNAIKLSIHFEKNHRKFISDGIVTIRNSYVLAEPN